MVAVIFFPSGCPHLANYPPSPPPAPCPHLSTFAWPPSPCTNVRTSFMDGPYTNQKRGNEHQNFSTIKHIKEINLNPCEVLLLLQVIHVCV